MRKASYTAVFAALFCLLFPVCDIFNTPLKDYIKDATGRTKGLGYEILTAHYMRADGTAAIPPADVSEQTKINVSLSNKEKYNLHITLAGEGSEYAGFTLSNNRRTILVTLLNQPREVDSVYVFDLTLNMTANDRPMPSVKLPRMECRYLDDHLAELFVSEIELSPSFRPDTTAYTVSLPHEIPSITLSGILPRFGACLIQDTRKSWTDDSPEFTHVIPVQDGILYTVPITVTADSGKTNVYSVQIAWPGMITHPYSLTLTIGDIIDAAAGAVLPQDITIARSGAGQFYKVEVTGTYDSIRWEIDGVGAGKTVTDTGKGEFKLDGSDVRYNTLGGHVLKLIVEKGGKKYQVNIPFTVVAQIFTSVDEFGTWLAAQPANTPATAYAVALNIDESDIAYLRTTLNNNRTKYVDIDLSGSTITSFVGGSAFYFCTSLTSVTIPNSVTSIGRDAFYRCESLASITIPNTVTSIGFNFVRDCPSLTAINVEPANTAYSSENGVLYNKDKKTLIQYPEGKTGAFTIPNSVISIGREAFSGCTGLTSVTIPDIRKTARFT